MIIKSSLTGALYPGRLALTELGLPALRCQNLGIVVDDLAASIDFFRELGLELEGRAAIEGEWAGRVTGMSDRRVEIANCVHVTS